MIDKLKNVFHTDTRFGKLSFIFLAYLFYFILFYALVPFLILYFQEFNFGGYLLLIDFLIIAPILSFKLFNFFKEVNIYLSRKVHLLIIILIPIMLFFFLYLYIIKNISIGGF